jgi:hypothetical protein
MSFLPYEGYSYYIDSDNFYHFNVVVPYSPYNYRVEVLSPVLPVVADTIVLPELTLGDFRTWVQSAEPLIEDENDIMYAIYNLLVEIARQAIAYELCGTPVMFKRVVSYYVAHYLELHIKALKDEENKMSLNPQTKSAEEVEVKKIEMVDTTFGNYKQTIWGQMFWTIYGQNAKFNIGYVPL